MKKTFTKLTLALALTGSALAFAVPSEAKPKCPKEGVCPLIYDPVICSDGQIYSNQCFANLACAKGCEPYEEQQ